MAVFDCSNLGRDGAVAIEGGRILAVGKASDMPPHFAPDETIDARGRLVLPGLFDTHIHNAQQLGRGARRPAAAQRRSSTRSRTQLSISWTSGSRWAKRPGRAKGEDSPRCWRSEATMSSSIVMSQRL